MSDLQSPSFRWRDRYGINMWRFMNSNLLFVPRQNCRHALWVYVYYSIGLGEGRPVLLNALPARYRYLNQRSRCALPRVESRTRLWTRLFNVHMSPTSTQFVCRQFSAGTMPVSAKAATQRSAPPSHERTSYRRSKALYMCIVHLLHVRFSRHFLD